MIQRLLICFMATLFTAGPTILYAEDITVEKLVENMVQAQETVKDMTLTVKTTDYASLTPRDPNGPNKESTGTVWIKRPHAVKQDMNQSTLYINQVGEEIVSQYYDPTTKQVVKDRNPVSALPYYFDLAGPVMSLQTYLYKDSPFQSEIAEVKGEKDHYYVVNVKSEGKVIETYYVNASNWLIQKVVVYDDQGLAAMIEWTSVKLNTGLKDKLFTPKFPKGTTVKTE